MKCGTSCSARTTRSGSGRPTTAQPGAWLTGSAATVTNGPSGGCSSASPAGKCALFCSDNDGVYPLVLAVGNHHHGKGETVALERNNGQQRHWTAALRRRRSIVVSKSLAMPPA